MNNARCILRYRTVRVAALFTLAFTPAAHAAEIYFLNTSGLSERYSIMRYEGRFPVPPKPVIAHHNSKGALHVAWPSALRVSGKERVYASRHHRGRWADIGIWESSDGSTFTHIGTALRATESEPHGIGPAHVYFAQGSYWMVYLVREQSSWSVGDKIASAVSKDGITWHKRGLAYQASRSWEAAGVSPASVTKADERWILTFQAFETLQTGHAAVATAKSPDGPYTDPQIIMRPLRSKVAVKNAKSGFAEVAGPIRVGEPYLLRSTSRFARRVAPELVTPIHQVGEMVYFDRPLSSDVRLPAELIHIGYNKVDPSYIWKEGDRWRGYWTAYGAVPDALAEYTFEVKAPALEGPWEIVPRGLAFSPWHPESLHSAENPTPLQVVP